MPGAARIELRLWDLLAQSERNKRQPSGARSNSMPDVRANAAATLFRVKLVATAIGTSLPVSGGGTLGRLTKWNGFSSSNSFIGDTSIFEDKYGNVGVGTDSPTSRLTVAGTVQSLGGGFKFPDGTIQTTAGIAPSQVVRSLNGLMGDVTLAAGANITITPVGNTITIAGPNALTGVFHDSTLDGNGTSGSPLSVAVPLTLFGPNPRNAILDVNNTLLGIGVKGSGEITGVLGEGHSTSDASISPGTGVVATGGAALVGGVFGGSGLSSTGGSGGLGGNGVEAKGGDQAGAGPGFAGNGIQGTGGDGSGAGNFAGDGILAVAGTAHNGAIPGAAGFFEGSVFVIDSCNGCNDGSVKIARNLNVTGTKNFQIDHPLDPENKYLYHAAVESSEVLNFYTGNVRLDGNGEAIIQLPGWFEIINHDFRYSLTSVGAPSVGLYIAEEISHNQFKIAGGQPGGKVSWQVTGVRSDPAMRDHPFMVEEDKPERERGTYLSPGAYGQPEEKGMAWARHPEMMQRLRQRRTEVKSGPGIEKQQ